MLPTSEALAPHLKTYSETIRYAKLTDLPRPLSKYFDDDYEDILPSLNLFRGLTTTISGTHTYGIFAGSGHNFSSDLDSSQRKPTHGKTIDVIIEQSKDFRSVFHGRISTLRVSTHETKDRVMSYDRAASGDLLGMPFECSDYLLFQKLFGISKIFRNQNKEDDKRKILVADIVLEDLKTMLKSKMLSSNDKENLDHYITTIHETQKNLQVPPSCSDLKLELQYVRGQERQQLSSFSRRACLENYFNMAALAFTCDISRMFFFHTNWGDEFKANQKHHHVGEDNFSDAENMHFPAQIWKYKLMLKFARKLQSIPDPSGNGTLFSNSLLLALNEHGGRKEHSNKDVPVVTMGDLGGRIRSGYFMDCRTQEDRAVDVHPSGHPVKQILISALKGMGVSKSEYIKYGDGNGFGEFVVDNEKYRKIFKGSHNDSMPFYFKMG